MTLLCREHMYVQGIQQQFHSVNCSLTDWPFMNIFTPSRKYLKNANPTESVACCWSILSVLLVFAVCGANSLICVMGLITELTLKLFSSVQSLSRVWLFATPWIAARPPCLSSIPRVYSNSCPLSWWCHPTISSSVVPFSCCPPIPPSIRVFSNKSTLRMRWPKYWSFSFSISPSNEHPGLISFRMDWLDLLAVQGTLKSLLQHHSSKASVL